MIDNRIATNLFVCIGFAMLMTSPDAGLNAQVVFQDIAGSAGIEDIGKNYGVSVVDYNKDGYDDIYVARSAGTNRLWRNNGDNTFTDVAVVAGVASEEISRVGLWADIDNDGWEDLYVGNSAIDPDILYRNLGDGTFEDIALLSGMVNWGNFQGAAWADVNADGLIDLYRAELETRNKLWINNGDLSFSEESLIRGVRDGELSMGVIFFDYDFDHDLDLYLTHDGRNPNYFLLNDGNGYFRNIAEETNSANESLGMGVDIVDANNDGFWDIYITNLFPNDFLKGAEDGVFTEVAADAGIDNSGMSWGVSFLDVDNDGLQDLYMSNTMGSPNQMYLNQGDIRFDTVFGDWQSDGNGYGLAVLDIDLDGRQDVFAANYLRVEKHLFHNESNSGNLVQLKLIGEESNRSAIGSRVVLWSSGQRQMKMIYGGSGWASQNSRKLHFGIGSAETVDSL